MSLSSMTGFARAQGDHGAFHWVWEIRSVNGRGLDQRIRMPNGLEGLEAEVRKRLAARFKRGSIQINLQLSKASANASLTLNEAALDQVLRAVDRLKDRVEAQPPTLDGLLSLRGVLELTEPEESDEDREARERALLASFDEALDGLAQARWEEGASLKDVLDGQVTAIGDMVARAEALAALQPEKLRVRLKEQVSLVMDSAASGLSQERLSQDVAQLLVKADMREEIDRLKAHIAAARDLLSSGEPVGRRLDFLIQEFNRESNTLCSKASDIALTQIGLDLKVTIDQMREQVQNVE